VSLQLNVSILNISFVKYQPAIENDNEDTNADNNETAKSDACDASWRHP
jgi:hypothetical protein